MSSTVISILVSVIAALILVISFFVGRKRGVGRTLLNGGCSLVGILLAFFLTPVITNALMGISVNIDGETSILGNFLSVYLINNTDFGTYIENSTSLQAFINGVVPAICAVIVYIVACVIFKLITFAIYKIVEKFAFKSKEEEEEEGRSRNKLGGGLVSVVTTFLFMLAIFLPLTSLTGFVESNFFSTYAEDKKAEASAITDTLDQLPSTAEISNEIPSDVKKIVSGYNRSIIGFCGNLFGLDDACFDYLSKININGEAVYIRKTADDLLGFYDYVIDLYDSYQEEPTDFFKNLDYDKLDNYKKDLLESGMFKGFVLNVVYDYSQNYEVLLEGTDFIKNYGDVLSAIKTTLKDSEKPNQLLLDDVYKLFDVVKSAGQSGFLDDVNALGESASAVDIITLAVDKYSNTFVSNTIDAVFNVNLVRSTFDILLDEAKDQLGTSDLENVLKTSAGKITDWDKFIFELKDIVTDVGDLYGHIKGANVDVDEFLEDYYLILKATPASVPLIVNDLGAILDKVNDLELMKNQDNEKILNDVLDALGFGDLLDGVVAPTGKTVNYTYVMSKLAPAARYVVEYDLYQEIKDARFVDAICKIADKVYADSLIEHAQGELTSQEKLEYIFKTLYDLPKIKELTVDEFTDDLASFVDISVLNDANKRDRELRHMTNILIELSKNKITVESEEQSFLKYLLTEGNDFEGLIEAIPEENVEALLAPILSSEMTDTICETIFTAINDTMIKVTGDNSLEFSYTRAKLQEQNAEICDIFEKFLAVYNSTKEQETVDITTIEYSAMGELLDAMKTNAYRGDLALGTENGIFNNAFDEIIAKAQLEYNFTFTKAMNKDKIYEVNFTNLFSFVETLEADTSSFKGAVKALLEGEMSTTKVNNVLSSITSDNSATVIATLEKAQDIGITVDVSEVTMAEEQTVHAVIDGYTFTGIDNGSDTDIKIKALLKGVLQQ